MALLAKYPTQPLRMLLSSLTTVSMLVPRLRFVDEPDPVLKLLQLLSLGYGISKFSPLTVGYECESEEGRAYGPPCLRLLHVHFQPQLSLEIALRTVPHTVG